MQTININNDLKERISDDWKDALRNKDVLKKNTLSLLKASIKNLEIERKTSELGNADIIGVIHKEISKRKDAATGFLKGGRKESASDELKEAEILEAYIPIQMSDDDLLNIIEYIIKENNASQIKDMGIVMKEATRLVAGRADNKRISKLIREKLS